MASQEAERDERTDQETRGPESRRLDTERAEESREIFGDCPPEIAAHETGVAKCGFVPEVIVLLPGTLASFLFSFFGSLKDL